MTSAVLQHGDVFCQFRFESDGAIVCGTNSEAAAIKLRFHPHADAPGYFEFGPLEGELSINDISETIADVFFHSGWDEATTLTFSVTTVGH